MSSFDLSDVRRELREADSFVVPAIPAGTDANNDYWRGRREELRVREGELLMASKDPVEIAKVAERGYAVIEPEVYESDPTRPGYSKLARTMIVDEVRTMIVERFGGMEAMEATGLEYLHISQPMVGQPWPKGQVIVYSVRGSSEGDYVHIEVIGHQRDGDRKVVMLAKTFGGRDASWALARRIADMLGC